MIRQIQHREGNMGKYIELEANVNASIEVKITEEKEEKE